MITLKAHLKSIASKGGKARAKKLTPQRRKEISVLANKAKKPAPKSTPKILI